MSKYTSFYERYTPLAMNMSQKSKLPFKHVSLITNKRLHILSMGVNDGRTHPLTVKLGYSYPYIHSEIAAFSCLSYNDKTQPLYLFNYRFNKNGVIGSSKPCKYCLPWCITFFENIFYLEGQTVAEINKK